MKPRASRWPTAAPVVSVRASLRTSERARARALTHRTHQNLGSRCAVIPTRAWGDCSGDNVFPCDERALGRFEKSRNSGTALVGLR